MDHETAVQLQAAERYVLDEFSSEERANFEEHFFGCPGCADEVRSATILAANAKVVLKAALDEKNTRKVATERPNPWNRFRFFWPLTASAALNFVLLGAFGLVGSHPADLPGRVIEPQFYRAYGVPSSARSTIPNFALPAGSRFFGARF